MFFVRRKVAPRHITVRDALRGCRAGRLQSVGYMQVIPLLSEVSDDRFATPDQCQADVYTTDYGTLGFRNSSDAIMIVPCHAGYVVKQHAQDHAMMHSAVMAPNSERRYDTAACIQASQGGLLAKGSYQMLILPHSLRENALLKRDVRDFRKIWDDISTFNGRLGLTRHGHLEYFLDAFKRELDEFVAEFESVPKQIGAIILINDRVVGVERAPSHSYWESIWPCLIRECYGSLAIETAKNQPDQTRSSASNPDRLLEAGSLDELESLIADLASQEEQKAQSVVERLLHERLDLGYESKTVGLSIDSAFSKHFSGQVIRDGSRVVYASLPATDLFISEQTLAQLGADVEFSF